MKIAGIYSFNGGREYIEKNFPKELLEVKQAITQVDAGICKTKKSKEKTMMDSMLYSPVELNKCFKTHFKEIDKNWKNVKEKCEYDNKYYVEGYTSPFGKKTFPYRDMDFVKNKLGVEIQFGKYSFMVYNVCAKMTIFKKFGHIDAGIEVVPVKELAKQMSTGVSYFEQFVWDLEQRGTCEIDIPEMIIGITA